MKINLTSQKIRSIKQSPKGRMPMWMEKEILKNKHKRPSQRFYGESKEHGTI